jgi:hypothetical protein
MGSEVYTRPIDFDAMEYVNHALAMTPATWPVEILLEATLEEARQYVLSVMATLDQTAGGLLLRCSIGNLDWFAHFLAGLPFSFTVGIRLNCAPSCRRWRRGSRRWRVGDSGCRPRRMPAPDAHKGHPYISAFPPAAPERRSVVGRGAN